MIDNIVVVHIEPQPDKRIDYKSFQNQIGLEISRNCPKEVVEVLYVRIRNNQESFPVAPSGKRDKNALIAEGTEQAWKVTQELEKLVGK